MCFRALSTGAGLDQFLNKSTTFDVQKDLQPIAMVAYSTAGVVGPKGMHPDG